MMSPPPAISGFIVPGLVSWKHLRMNTHPRDLYDKLKKMPGFAAKEFAWDFDMEKKASMGVPQEEYENWVRFHIRREKHWFEILRYLMKNESCSLTGINFDGTDKLLHIGWRFLDPATFPKNPTPWDIKMREACLEYFRHLDRFIAEAVEIAGPDARVFMASDHGFGPSREVFRVNTWLHANGYLTWKEIDQTDEKNQKSVEKLVERHFVFLDWERTTAYARSTTSNGIYIRVARGANSTGVPAEQYHPFRQKLIDKLKTIRDPDTGEQIIKRILTKEEAYPGSHNEQAPDLTLVMRDHSFISILNRTPVIHNRAEIEGTHYPQGIFIAGGPGIKQGTAVPELNIADVAPCLLYSLGLDIPADFDGKVPMDVFEPSYLKNHPVRIGKPTESVTSYARHAEQPAMDDEEKAQVFDKLRALGYLE
jgi:predicted AlkP superfamily phosphohydrolase/phosphomutase